MAITKMEHMEGKGAFGKKIFALGVKNRMRGPAAIARGLYDSDECFELIHIKDRPIKIPEAMEMDIDTFGRTVQRHFDAEKPIEVSSRYLLAYSILFNTSLDYLYGKVDDDCPNVDILAISQKTGLSINAIARLNDAIDERDGRGQSASFIQKCWSHLIENELYYQLPFDWHNAYAEECERLKCLAALDAIGETVAEMDSSIGSALIEMKAKPISKAGEGHYAAYYGMLHKLAQDIISRLDSLVNRQIKEDGVYEREHRNMLYQFQCELAVAKGKPMPPKPDDDFHWHSHIVV